MSHHTSERDPYLQAIMRELNLGATGEYPDGKLCEADEGEIRIAVAADVARGVVLIDFGKPVASIGFTAAQASDLADSLRDKAAEADPGE